ncbi:MAG: type II secretion system F family protein [Thermoleophilia bacterium]|nr:type II secretion system F family protein [Thermoleophilia bacterium]
MSLAGPLLAACAAVAMVAGVRSVVAIRPARSTPWAWSSSAGLAMRLPGGGALSVRIRRAGLPVGPDAILLASAGAGVSAALVLLAVFRRPVVASLGLLVGLVVLRVALSAADRRYMRRVGDAMPAVAQMLAGAVAAGLSLRQALIRAARDTPDPLGAELRQAASEMELGARVDDALAAMAARLPDPDLGLLVTAILVQRRTGGDLARALRDMSGRLEERARLARELRGATAQARATAWMVAALPVMGAALAEAAAPGLIARTASSPAGIAVLVASVGLQALGILIIRRIAAVPA